MGENRCYLILEAVQSESPIDIDEFVLKLNEDKNAKSITKEQIEVLIDQIKKIYCFKKNKVEHDL